MSTDAEAPLSLLSLDARMRAVELKNGILPPPNEPVGLTTIHDWDGHSQGIWQLNPGAGAWTKPPTPPAYVLDDLLHDTVTDFTYGPWAVPSNLTAGPGHFYISIPKTARPLRTLYLRTRVWLSTNWKQHPTGDQKLFQIFADGAGGYSVGLILYGRDGAIRPMAYSNNDPIYGAGVPLGQLVTGKKVVPVSPDVFTLGAWHELEYLIGANTPGQRDGTLRVWMDRRPQTSLDDVVWSPANATGAFVQFDLNPLWGGLGGTLTAAQHMRVGPIHLSGSTVAVTP